MTRREIDGYTDFVKKLGASGLIWIKVNDLEKGSEGLHSSIAKHVTPDELMSLVTMAQGKSGDIVFIGAGKHNKISTVYQTKIPNETNPNNSF